MESKELLKILQENLELPVVFFTNNDTDCDDYNWTFRTKYSAFVSTIYDFDERVCEDEDEAREYLENYYGDYEEYCNMTDEEYKEVIDKKLEESKHYKAIVLWVN